MAKICKKSKGILKKASGGGLTRKDRGSDKKPYPTVKKSDFAGGSRSYPIPTKADAVDALRLAGLHGRSDVRAKVYKKYPSLRKKKKMQYGGVVGDPEMIFKDRYNTPLTAAERKEYDKWVKEESARQGRDITWDKGTYDMQGFWKYDQSTDKDGHGHDKWKKPNHPKFSNESIYHGKDGFYGGAWEGHAFQPSKQTVDLYGEAGIQRYFDLEPERPEYLDMSRFKTKVNKPTPLVYKKGGILRR
jgi:hypothetical protein